MPTRSPLSSVTPALSIATSVPVPIAMPTSAAASAGASLTPSPAIATTRPALRSFSTTVGLAVRQHLGLDLGDAEPARDGLRGRAVVAGQHHDADAVCAQRLERVGRRRLDRVGDGDDARGLAVDRDEDRGGAVLPQPLGLGCRAQRCRCRARRGTRRCRSPRGGRRPCRSRPCRSANRNRARVASSSPAFARGLDDGRAPADARCRVRRWRQAAALRSSSKPCAGNDGDDLRPAFGQRAGLVDHQRVDLLHPFERLGVA